MSVELTKLLDNCIEIEGLLSLLIVKEDHATTETLNLLKTKVSSLKNDIDSIQPQPEAVDESGAVGSEVLTIVEKEMATESETESAIIEVPQQPIITNESISATFSINDRFLYCRELFNSNKEEMDETLVVTSRMNSDEEIEDYLFNDLCLDPNDETVANFLSALKSRLAH